MKLQRPLTKSIICCEKHLESIGLKSGTLLNVAKPKYFNVAGKNRNNEITIVINPHNGSYTVKQNSVAVAVEEEKYKLISPEQKLLFIGFEPFETDVSIKSFYKNYPKNDKTYKLNRLNYLSFYDDTCIWNKDTFCKSVVDNLVEMNFHFNVLKFLHNETIIWWVYNELEQDLDQTLLF
jgi:hypothetical protein